MMKIRHNLLISTGFLILVHSCGDDNKEELPDLFQSPKISNFNTSNSYDLNPFSGDSTSPVIYQEDTLFGGIPILVNGVEANRDSLEEPNKLTISLSDSNRTNMNVNDVSHIRPIKLQTDSIEVINIGLDTSSLICINELGDTIKTGVKLPLLGEVTIPSHNNSNPALTPAYFDRYRNGIRSLDDSQGLLSAKVVKTFEDSRGYIWILTDGKGVSMYNGSTFRHYLNSDEFSEGRILDVVEDNDGNMWFGTFNNGLWLFDGTSFTHFTEANSLSSNWITGGMDVDQEGNVWIGYGCGMSCFNLKENYVIHYSMAEGLQMYPSDIVVDSENKIWFCGWKGLSYFDQESNSFSHLTPDVGIPEGAYEKLHCDVQGQIWSSYSNGIIKIKGDSITHYERADVSSDENSSYFRRFINGFAENKDGDLWMTSENGLILFKDLKFTQYSYKEHFNLTALGSIMFDSGQNLWISSAEKGVLIYNSSLGPISNNQDRDRLNDKFEGGFIGHDGRAVMSVFEDEVGRMWCGSRLTMLENDVYTRYGPDQGFPTYGTNCFASAANQSLWIGHSKGATHYDGKEFVNYDLNCGLMEGEILSILEGSDELVWFGGVNGICKWDKKTSEFTHYDVGLANITSIVELDNGQFWFGSYMTGLTRFDSKSSEFTWFGEEQGLSSNNVICLKSLSGNRLAIGTADGLNIIDESKITYFGIDQGLYSKRVATINEDSNERVWITTTDENNLSYGIDKIEFAKNRVDNKTVIVSYTRDDGLSSSRHLWNGIITKDDELWYGMRDGVLKIDGRKTEPKIPEIHMENILVNGIAHDFCDSSVVGIEGVHYERTQPFQNYPIGLVLDYNKNHLTFEFGAIDWSAPRKIKYSYRIEGLDGTWSVPSAIGIADYRNLPYGTHTFQVCSMGESQLWSEPFEYTFTIKHPWWLKWWAFLFYAAAGLYFIFLGYRIKSKKLIRRQRMLESTVEKRTEEVREQKNEAEHQRDMVEEKNREILDSMTYAKRLQTAILPPQKLVKEWLNDSFIFYKPKDIVAGDFYWMETTKRNGRNIVFYAAADCTGHGVPGAMVSVVCSNALKRAIKEFDISDPGELLDKVAELVQESFEQSEHEVKDGMDIAVCAIDLIDRKVWFSGANNALYRTTGEDTKIPEGLKVTESGNRKLVEYGANKQPVGSYEHMEPFTTTEIQLEPGDCIYLFSDGFADQFGGEKGKKFKYKPFKQLLLEIELKEMDSQKDILDTEFERWKGNLEQVDDVCIIGLRVNGHMRKLFSKRELEVIQKIKEGRQSKEIAEELNLTKSTVDTYRKRILAKTNLGNAAELIKFCDEHEVI